MAIRTKNKANNGVRGMAEVRVLADYLRVIFKADGDTYQVKKNGWDRESGVYNVTLNKSNDEIKFVSPPGGLEPFIVKFMEFSNRVGASDSNPGVPEPKIDPGGMRPGKNGTSYYAEDRLVARAKLEILVGPYKGLHIIYTLPYLFTQDDLVPTFTMFEGTAGQRKILEGFLVTAGLDMVNDEIPWSGNVLPFIESKLQAVSKIFSVRLNEKGFVDKDGISPIPSYMIDSILGAAKKKVKAPAKKVVAKKAAGKSK